MKALRKSRIAVVVADYTIATRRQQLDQTLRPARQLGAEPHDEQDGLACGGPEYLMFQRDSVCFDLRHEYPLRQRGVIEPARWPSVKCDSNKGLPSRFADRGTT